MDSSVYDIKEIQSFDEIKQILIECADSFYDQSNNNMNFIESQAEKFHKFGIFHGLFRGDRNVGFIAFYANDSRDYIAYLSMIIVNREYQHNGYGRILLEDVIMECKKRGMCVLRLEVADTNTPAIALYEKKGFKHKSKKSSSTSIWELHL